jgi:hypothetical protein
LTALGAVAARIASGDRYALIPKQPRGPLSELAKAAESMRDAVIEADTLVVDQRRREAETRLPRRSSRRSPPSTISLGKAASASSCSAPTPSIRAPPTPF